jgi:hypothetical protein
VDDDDDVVDPPLTACSSGPRPLMRWSVFVAHLLMLAVAALLYCYGYLDAASPARACCAAVGMGVLLWVGGRLGHEGA